MAYGTTVDITEFIYLISLHICMI